MFERRERALYFRKHIPHVGRSYYLAGMRDYLTAKHLIIFVRRENDDAVESLTNCCILAFQSVSLTL